LNLSQFTGFYSQNLIMGKREQTEAMNLEIYFCLTKFLKYYRKVSLIIPLKGLYKKRD